MMMTHDQFIEAVEARAAEIGISPNTLCERARQGGKFFANNKSGKTRCWPETMQKILSYADSVIAKSRDEQSSENAA